MLDIIGLKDNAMKICAHVMVKNEARFVWFAVMSVLPHVDEMMIWDTGSTDDTKDIIQEILRLPQAKDKVSYKEIAREFDEELTRQEMLDETSSDWFLVVDADEIWWGDSIKKVVNMILRKGNQIESIVVPTIVPVGDIFHRQEERAGRYKLAGKIGHYNLRAVNRKIAGLHSSGAHGVWGWADGDNKMIQDRVPKKIEFVNAPYLHVTHLPRSEGRNGEEVSKRMMKLKYEIGEPFPADFFYPEVLFMPRPSIVKSPWKVMDPGFKFISYIETPLRMIKRRIWWGKAGY